MSSTSDTTIRRAARANKAGGTLQTAVHVGFAVCAAVFVLVYSRTYFSLAETWADTGTFQYAFLIFPISAVLVWARRDWLSRVAARARPAGLWMVAALGGLWLLGSVADVNLARHIAVVVIWPVLVYVFYGPRVVCVLAFALGYLLFAVPFGEFMVGPLQTITAHLSVLGLKLSGVPVFMEGHFIDTPASVWHVAEACSGIKFFVATAAFGVLYAHLFFTSLRRRLIFVVISLVVPVIANGLRVYFTILIGEYFGMHYATGTDHLIFGWQFFGAVMILLFVCGWPWHEPPAKGPEADMGRPENAAAPMRWMVPVALALIVVPAAWYAVTGLMASRADAGRSLALPAQLASRAAIDDQTNTQAGPPERNLDVHLSRRYGDIARPVQVDYLGANAGSDGPDMLSIRQGLYDPAAWGYSASPATAGGGSGPSFVVLRLEQSRGKARRIMLYAYRIGSRWTTSPTTFKLWRALDRLIGRSAATGLVVVSEAGQTDPKPLIPMANAATKAITGGA